jgi:hypothetical protein
MLDETEVKEIRVSCYGGGRFSLSGLSEQDIEKLRSVFSQGGPNWVRMDKAGCLVFSDAYKPLPNPTNDSEMFPFWKKPYNNEIQMCMDFIDFEDIGEGDSPSIYINHLCGYFYTAEFYKTNANLLTSYGFSIMRSKRGDDGRFWETWYLPGLWSAKGELQETLNILSQKTNKEKLDVALRFLCRKVSFGSLDVSIQKLAMSMD